MIDRRLALLLLAAIGLGGYTVLSGDSALMQRSGASVGAETELRQTSAPSQDDVKPAKAVNLNPLAELTLADFAEIAKRPLFNPTRAPAPPPPEPEPEAAVAEPPPTPVEEPTNPDDFALLGVASNNGSWTVVMRWNPSNEIHRLKTGGEIQGWSVADVTPQKVTLSRGDQTIDIKMFQNLASRPPGMNANVDDPAENPEMMEGQYTQQRQMNPQLQIQDQQ
jgi:hypothetical protein